MLYILLVHQKEKAYSFDKNVLIKFLKDYKNETKYKLGVTVLIDEEDYYKFSLGWEERIVEAKIISKELNVRLP